MEQTYGADILMYDAAHIDVPRHCGTPFIVHRNLLLRNFFIWRFSENLYLCSMKILDTMLTFLK